MCSLTNFLLSAYVARSLGAAEFGAFGLAYVTYGFAINASRGLSIEPLLIRYSGTDLSTWKRATSGSTGTALLVGLVTGTCALTVGALAGGTVGLAFIALGLTLPGLLLQDSWRYAFFALGRGHLAFINDTIWALIQIPLLVIMKMTGHANVFWFIIAWGAGGAVGAVVGAVQVRVMPRLSRATHWLGEHRDLGFRYLVENTGGNAADTVRSYGASSILGLTTLGDINASAVLMGPFKIILFGVGMITIPEATHILRRSPRKLPVFCVGIGVGLTVLAGAWALVLLAVLPLGVGHLMLGSIWRPAYPLVVPTALAIMGGCAATGANIGLHALGAARRSLRSTIITAVMIVVFALGGAWKAGAPGTLYGAALGSCLGMMVSWWSFRKAMEESGTVPVPAWLLPSSTARHRRPPGSPARPPHPAPQRDGRGG
jgi:O-antigen/teichoic acid export membrane protein